MPGTSTLSSVEIDVGEKPYRLPQVEPDTPFRILVAGDFSGGAGRNRRVIEIDRDNFDDVLSRTAPELRLNLGETELPVRFRELDDFHPDRLFERLAPFRALRDLRARLSNRATFASAAAEFASATGSPAGQQPGAPQAAPPPELRNVSGADLLRMMAGDDEPEPAAKKPVRADWDQMIHEIAAPHTHAGPDPRQPEMIARTDAAISETMRALLHAPQFQALEAAWRGLFFLTRRLDTGQELKVFMVDLPQSELASLPGVLDGEEWALITGLYSFGEKDSDALAGMAAHARSAGAPFIAGLAPEVVGIARAFETLRNSPYARWIGLAMPRFLLRLPYGKKADETETFAFEELSEHPEHEGYLWGNPSIACAYLLGEAFLRDGWHFRPGAVRDIEGLPTHVYQSDGESELKPCAEVLLTEAAAELLIERGFMPLASIKGTDIVRVVKFQSVAQPHAPLGGRWD